MILHINFRRTALIASVALVGASQAQALGVVPGMFPPRGPSSALSMPMISPTVPASQSETTAR